MITIKLKSEILPDIQLFKFYSDTENIFDLFTLF